MKELYLTTKKVPAFEVSLGDGYKVKGENWCPQVDLELQGMRISQPFYPFELGGADMVLGIEWLKDLGEVKMNWGQLTMKVKEGDKEWCIKGGPALAKTLVP